MGINPATDMNRPQGLDKTMKYEGIVVENDDSKHHEDKRMLGRVKIKVPGIFDGIHDDFLPWAIPSLGSNADGSGPNSGSFSVPKKGTKVLITFQDGSAQHPKYSPYTIDQGNMLEEAKHNYPNRIVHLHSNGALQVVDTQSNEAFIRNPGDLNLYIVGDLNLKVDGNVIESIEGNKTTYVKGNSTEVVKGNRSVFVTGDDLHSASGHIVRSGARIDDNPGGGSSAPPSPTLPAWPGIRGKIPDSN
jgi:hypothetical protein